MAKKKEAGQRGSHTAALSKTLFVRGCQCHKSLWLQKFKPELKDEESPETTARFAGGNMIGELARDLFPGGVLIPFEEDGERVPLEDQLRRTKEAMEGGAKVIYEAAFQHDGIFVKVDLLRKRVKGWELYEAKAGTSVKDVYLLDSALQYFVLAGAGVPLGKAYVVHVNTEYVREGDVDLGSLLTCQNVTKEVKGLQAEVRNSTQKMRAALAQKKVPSIDIGPHCFEPYECDFQGHCWGHIPEDSVFDLRGRGVDQFALYYQGIVSQADIPLDLLQGKQKQQVQATLRQEDHVDRKAIRAFLNQLSYPLYFLDFETFISAVPPFDGTSPYQQIPFQYSLHYQKRRGGKIHHVEFLAVPGEDPRKALLKSLLAAIPDGSCVLAYNSAFENRVLKDLAGRYKGHRARVNRIVANMRDLMVPFNTRACYKWEMKGGYSIKNVLPALVPELSYSGLKIANGGAAMEAYHEMCAVKDKPEELAAVRGALLEYCKLDTLAMVRILEKLYQLAS
ncbi:DUF2779 domain-containing protein [Geomonas nitrogeniifigens]|uniref:DUF2779 domain-containing protein n=1 Tax=Geomonas diazotrophica TaxID=2843197 RepID=UPI001C2C5680|nr:DUF2779 domain-containing protein [Geomonas nitrogeniifigens]QXE87349.1 DUF2779 domain-containing protein [Geomonas nitrogeniifigens]